METDENRGFVYEFGEFVLDPKDRTLFAGGVPIHLPAKEFETLLLLVEHNGRALTKEEMMSVIWQDAFVEESNLAKQISRLRKIFDQKGVQFIETLPKHGYRFSADLHARSPEVQGPVILEKRTVQRVTLAFEEETDSEPKALPATSRSLLTLPRIALVGLLAVVAAATFFIWNQRSRPISSKINTMAVLPLRPLNGGEDAKALGLGLTDALITRLGSLHRVVVRPTDAVVSFTGPSDPIETGRKLNVDAVLEGTIQQADGKLRVNARLLNTQTGEQIWAEKFDEAGGGIFELQDALSANIAKALAFELTKSDSDQLIRRGTENAEAYEKYLRGRFYQSQNTADGLNRSIELYQQAITLDPKFAEAYASIADANVIMFNFGLRPAAETIPQARQAVNRALQLNPDLSNAYTSLALIQFLGERNWTDAEKSLQRAFELDPNNADAFVRYGYFLINVGRFDDALEKLEKARELNPLSAIVQGNIGLAYLCMRRYPQAIEQLERTAADNPQFPFPQWLLGASYEDSGDPEKAFAAYNRALEIEGEGELATRLRKLKETDGLDAANRLWLDETAKAGQVGRVSALTVATRAATVKDRDQTLTWLEKSLQEDDPTLGQIKYLAKYDFVRDDPRFQAVVAKLPY